MQLTRNEQLEKELLQEIDDSMYDGDRKQPSVSGMIYCLTKTYYGSEMITENEDGVKREQHNEDQIMLFITGLGLEKTLLSGRQVSEGGEYEGIQWHLDHFGTDGRFMEVKSTRGSSNSSDDISEGWRKQILAYFKVKNITEGDLTILHLMGNYKPPFPQLRCWNIQSTQQEVDENWNWIKQRAEVYGSFVAAGTPPTPFKYNMDWECKYCNWKGLCDARATLSNMGARTI